MTNYHKKPEWALKTTDATPESIFWEYQTNRRQLLQKGLMLGLGSIAAGVAPIKISNLLAHADNKAFVNMLNGQLPAKLNKSYDARTTTGRFPITDEALVTSYNNFYEFGSSKFIADNAKKFSPYPWTLTVDGLVDNPKTFDLANVIKQLGLETRVYRHRCVEAWSFTAPWSGFPLKKLLGLVGVKNSAKYVAFETLADKKSMPGLRQAWYPWPYREGLLLTEAMHDLAFLVVGAYEKPLPNQNGAPLRLALPWKYGFKSIKSIVRISLTNEMPQSFWMKVAGDEYGFFANVNPQVPHRRWSQAKEQVLGQSGDKVPTLKYNGYEAWVAGLYKNMPQTGRELFY